MYIDPAVLPDTIIDGGYITRELTSQDVYLHYTNEDDYEAYLLIPLRLSNGQDTIVVLNKLSRAAVNDALRKADVPTHKDGARLPEAGAFIQITREKNTYVASYTRPRGGVE